MKKACYLCILMLFISSCTVDPTNAEFSNMTLAKEDTLIINVTERSFVTMQNYAKGFVYDMKYASEDNFLNKKVYICDHCWLRKEVADGMIKANEMFIEMGYRIKFFDCYRPLDVQKIMWEIFPDDRYVANPYTTGSVHNRGGAVDITLIDMDGNELDMGTEFDHFGKEAGHSYTDLPDTVLANRILLKTVMEATGFSILSSEWWHYNHKNALHYKLSNFQIECN